MKDKFWTVMLGLLFCLNVDASTDQDEYIKLFVEMTDILKSEPELPGSCEVFMSGEGVDGLLYYEFEFSQGEKEVRVDFTLSSKKPGKLSVSQKDETRIFKYKNKVQEDMLIAQLPRSFEVEIEVNSEGEIVSLQAKEDLFPYVPLFGDSKVRCVD